MAPAAPSIRRPSDPEVGVAESDRAGSLAVEVLARIADSVRMMVVPPVGAALRRSSTSGRYSPLGHGAGTCASYGTWAER
jgi:hypothetical protein